MKKRILASLLCIAILTSMAACGRRRDSGGDSKLSNLPAPSELTMTSEAEITTTEDPTDIITEKSTTESDAASAAEDLGTYEQQTLTDDIYDYQIVLDGIVYTIPLMVKELESTGWVCSDDREDMIPAQSYGYVSFTKGENRIHAEVKNYNVNQQPIKDCVVNGIDIDYTSYHGEAEIAGHIKFMEAKRDDVIARFGSPSDGYEGNYFFKDTYKVSSYQEVVLTYDCEQDLILREISVVNFEEPEGLDKGEVSAEIPEILATYQAPTGISSNVYDYTFLYAGDYYQLPAPVSEFTKNGWTIVENKSDMYVAGSDSGKLTMSKDNQVVWTYVRNYDLNATAIENCYVTELKASVHECNVEMEVTGGIRIGDSKADLEAALKALNVPYEEEDGDYRITDERSITYHVDIHVYEDVITTMEVQYQPYVSDYREMMGF